MLNSSFVLFYVQDAAASLKFYSQLLDREPVENSPNFAMFAFDSGLKLAIWSRDAAKPAPVAEAGSCELLFMAENAQALDAMHDDWLHRGLRIAQEPVTLDFGYTFVALDRDGHRLRVLAPGSETSHEHA
ncbi:VOC family protein [Phyllobacterium sp. YR531]|uniref:VOC family protein n=1 Tax=Phyllobacterium sp. YR531 TaxID=1144343 RepID=UPI00026FB2B6|nr:VOC family protein [Phyllobacterium sp. YR531]EJN00348.1 lactoylglutathione lyase-like lyase [Phyllobacterium sp. YR531]